MEITSATVEELPPSVRWFAPWTWKRRWMWIAAIPILAVYFLTAGSVEYLLIRYAPNPVYDVGMAMLAPAMWAEYNVSLLERNNTAQFMFLQKRLGISSNGLGS